jgi:hypothetical protein
MARIKHSRKNNAYNKKNKTHKKKNKVTRKPRAKKSVRKSRKGGQQQSMSLMANFQKIAASVQQGLADLDVDLVSRMGVELLSQPIILASIYLIVKQAKKSPTNMQSHIDYVKEMYADKRYYVMPQEGKSSSENANNIRNVIVENEADANKLQIISTYTFYRIFIILTQDIMFKMFSHDQDNKFLPLFQNIVARMIKIADKDKQDLTIEQLTTSNQNSEFYDLMIYLEKSLGSFHTSPRGSFHDAIKGDINKKYTEITKPGAKITERFMFFSYIVTSTITPVIDEKENIMKSEETINKNLNDGFGVLSYGDSVGGTLGFRTKRNFRYTIYEKSEISKIFKTCMEEIKQLKEKGTIEHTQNGGGLFDNFKTGFSNVKNRFKNPTQTQQQQQPQQQQQQQPSTSRNFFSMFKKPVIEIEKLKSSDDKVTNILNAKIMKLCEEIKNSNKILTRRNTKVVTSLGIYDIFRDGIKIKGLQFPGVVPAFLFLLTNKVDYSKEFNKSTDLMEVEIANAYRQAIGKEKDKVKTSSHKDEWRLALIDLIKTNILGKNSPMSNITDSILINNPFTSS